jgi:hypothetical protein
MFDMYSVLVVTALVVNVSGIVFIVETLLRRDEGAGRIWTLAFLAGMLTTLAYLIWTQSPHAWWAVAAGNGAFVAATGCMWLGCRRFNGRRMLWACLLVTAGVGGAAVSAAVEGGSGDPWAGALWMFVPLLGFAAVGAVECYRGALRESRTAWVLGVVLAVQALYYVSRTTAFVTSGPDSPLFQNAFGTVQTSFLTVVLTIVAVVVASVLRAGRAPMRGYLSAAPSEPSGDGILADDAFPAAFTALVGRAQPKAELVGVIAVRIADLDEISTAFGSEVARDVSETWRAGVRRWAPSDALVGDDAAAGMLVGAIMGSARQAESRGGDIYRGLIDALGEVAGGVIPVVGVGIALSSTVGYDVAELIDVARATAARAAASVDAAVLLGEPDGEEDAQAAVSR